MPFPAPWAGEPLVLLLAALCLDALLPPLPGLRRYAPNPLRALEALSRWLSLRLDRPFRSEATRLVRGAAATALVVALAAGLGWAVGRIAERTAYGAALELVLLVLVLGQRRLAAEVQASARALARGPGGLVGARTTAAALLEPGWDCKELDGYGVARLAVEAAAVGFAERVVTPVFWFILLGLPGAFAAVAAHAMANHGPGESRFSLAARRLDDVLEFLPVRLAAFLLALAALLLPRGHPIAAIEAMTGEGAKHATLNRGWPIAAVAGALDLTLAGPRRTAEGGTVKCPWIGSGRARAEAADVRRALWLLALACAVNAALVGLLAVLAQAF